MAAEQRYPAHKPTSGGQTYPSRPTIESERRAADRALSAFAHARSLAIRARHNKDMATASELDRFAWSLVGPAEPVRVSYAQHRLGISNTTARAWMDRGILRLGGESPRRVTLESLARTEEILSELCRGGNVRDMTSAIERRLRWERWRQDPEFERGLDRIRRKRAGTPQGHQTADRRSLAFHRRVAQDLDRKAVATARARVEKWIRDKGPVPPVWATQWHALLERPMAEIKRTLTQDSDQMRELRQNTPFAGALPETDRMRLISEVH